MRGGLHAVIIAIVTCLSAASSMAAEEWPTKPIRAIVPLSAGSAADIIPRVVFEQVSTQLGRPIIVENRTGASGTIGTRAVENAAPDGYTLLAHSSAFVISPSTVANASYDPVKDFSAVVLLGNLPNVLVIAPSKNLRTVQEFVAAAKLNPVTFGSVGVGSPIHLTMERFRLSAGFEAQQIPFRGAPEALTEVMTGRVDVYYSPILPALEFIRSGKLLPLSVSSAKRASALPNVPTTLEAGYPNSDYNFWIGVFAPAGTPRYIVEKLNQEITKALGNPTVQEKLLKLGVEPMLMNTEQFDEFVKNEVAKNAALAKTLGLTPN